MLKRTALVLILSVAPAYAQTGVGGSRVTDLPQASIPLSGAEQVLLTQQGVSKQTSAANIMGNFFGPSCANPGLVYNPGVGPALCLSILPSTFIPNPITSSILITASGTPTPIIENLALGGTATLLNVNQILIASDTLPCAFCTDFYIQHYFGGASARGAHEGIFSWVIQTAPNTGSGTTVGIAATFIGQSNLGDGGSGVTTATSKGTYFGVNAIGRNAGTNVQEVTASEFDLQTTGASTAQYAFGNTLVNQEAAQGSGLDAALAIYTGGSTAASGGAGPWGPGLGFHNGISFAELSSNGLSPVDSGATLIGGHLETLSTINAAYGIDLRNFTFSGAALISNDFSVTQAGFLTAVNEKLTGLVTGTPAASLCADSTGNIIKKTTTGSCI